MNLLETITVEPWPIYPLDGGLPRWNVTITTTKGIKAYISWSIRLGRFTKSWALMNLRRGAPQAHRDAAEYMRQFCSKMQQFSASGEAGQKESEPGQNSKTPGQTAGTEPGHLARAGNLRFTLVCPGGTQIPGRDTTGQGQNVSEIAGGSGLTPALINQPRDIA